MDRDATPLQALLIRQIAATGPMTVADYIAACLFHPEHGYYSTRDPLGRAGDFVTAPEVSQMFGELVGLALAQAWREQGAPGEIVLAEIGGGRGTLMADALRATAAVPGFHAALSLHMVEVSPVLSQRQARTLADHAPVFHGTLDALPDGPLYLIANEVFDCLPVRQFLRHPAGWSERMVGLREGTLAFGLSEAAPLAALDDRLAGTEPGQLVQTCAPALQMIGPVLRCLQTSGGAALIFDYGDRTVTEDTLQALRGHQSVSPLHRPGESDLTAHVAFGPLMAEAEALGLPVSFETQGAFLERLGITVRARTLARALSGEALNQHIAAHRRLTHPAEMGTLFKVLGLTGPGQPPPPGFATST